ncbi:DNA gyrase subunit A [bacterium]|nr:DNA gyrase subunit A [bacterium]
MDDTTNVNIIPVTIEEEMRGSYLDYAMSVIIGRALPDVRDGLKPVHRRILYAMLREGLLSNRKFSKCAGVVGEVLKHFHPHGDAPVYQALVRMAQSWNLRYPLIDGQGNFGSIDGDSAAAYRYTESRMTALAEMLLADIDQDTVDFSPNFDGSVDEPVVLPSRIPNLLINGAEGIAVGMASSIPPHNLQEITRAAIELVKNPDLSVSELMEFVPGPDFPTAGIIYGAAPIRQMYQTGRGLLQLRSKVHYETLKTGKREAEAIIIDEIPYQTNKAKLIEKIAELVNEKKIEGISRLRDESDRRGMRIVVELKRDAVADVALNQLMKLTPMQRTFGVIMLGIVDGKPQVMGLKELLQEFIKHRQTVIIRRSRHLLGKAEARLHILEGLRTALDHIDEVIKVIKASDSTADAKLALQQRFKLSEVQSQHILDMPLRRLTGLERKAIEDEYQEVELTIQALKKILSSAKEVDNVVITELEEVIEKFGDPRRTQIETDASDIGVEDMIAEEDMVVTISHKGYAKRCSPSLYRAQNRGGKGVRGTKKLDEEAEDFVSQLFVASTHAYLLVFTSQGKLHWLKVYELPESARTARGRALVNMIKLQEGEKVSAILPVRTFEHEKQVVMVTREGYIKRVDLMDFSNVRNGGIRATNLDEGDELIGVMLTDGKRDIIVQSKDGMSIRFHESEARVMGRTARGVRAMNLNEGDYVVNIVTVYQEEAEGKVSAEHEAELKDSVALLTVSENGYGKRTLIDEYRTQGRGGKGVIDIKTDERNGNVVSSADVKDNDQVMIITTSGNVIRIPVKTISIIGRNTKGVRLINLEENEKVAAVAKLAESEEEASE